METRANYLRVGSFAILVIVASIIFFFWLANDTGSDNITYRISFEGSVNGLNVGSPVRFLGVRVGQVSDIKLDLTSGQRVNVFVSLGQDVPIRTDTIASLSYQGVTGTAYITLTNSEESAVLLPHASGDEVPVIPSKPSELDALIEKAPEVMGRLANMAEQGEKLMSDENIESIRQSLANIERLTSALAFKDAQMQRLIEETNATATEMRRFANSLNASLPGIAEPLQVSSRNLAAITGRLDALMGTNEDSLNRLAGQGLDDLADLLSESKRTMRSVRSIADSLRDDPSQVIYQPDDHGIVIPE